MKKLFTLILLLGSIAGFTQKPSSLARKYKEIASGTEQLKGNFSQINAEKSARIGTQEALYNANFLNNYKVFKDSSDQVIFIENNSKALSTAGARKSVQTMGFEFLETVKTSLKIKNPAQEFEMTDMQTDAEGQTHIRIQQKYNNIPVYGGELILHSKGDKIDLLNGRAFPTPNLTNLTPTLSEEKATEFAMKDVAKRSIVQVSGIYNKFLNIEKTAPELVIYHKKQLLTTERLTYKTIIRPNMLERWVYFVDANTGEILEKYNHTCTLDGPKSASAKDLNGVTQALSTYQSGSKYYMIDTSRPMFSSTKSQLPDNPIGAIWTIDGLNSKASADNPNMDYVASSNNADWNATAVSAHYNGGIAYDYYRKTFNRNSLDGKGGTIISVINIADDDGGGMDNAYWNGQFMAYGNGRTAFRPLAAALDVAGHEMTHGVVEATAKLEYLSQSGAINESMADIFGAMIDRSNWTIGEGVVKASAFPSGALRSLSNPNQGGKSDPGYQPKTMSQYRYLQETEDQDNGGVHINSGIPNYAFYLIASNASVGKDKAEQVYYQALTKYLTHNSQFVDLRLAVIQSVKDKYPSDANMLAVAKSAFDAVGILDPNASTGSTTNTPPTPTQTNIPTSSTGTDYILVYDPASRILYNGPASTASGKIVVNENNYKQISAKGLMNKPSVQDDGSNAYYVGLDKNIYQYNFATAKETKISFIKDGVWANAAVSKDGKRLAALTAKGDVYIYVMNLVNNKTTQLKLYNPTSANGVSTGEVQYADSFEWDYSGEKIVYDAFNKVTSKTTLSSTTSSLEYWDVGIMKVWDVAKNDFSTGQIQKIFSALDPGENIGDPSFSKTSADILAFDYFNEQDDAYYVLGVNLALSGDAALGSILTGNNDIGYPNYSRLDDFVMFNSDRATKKDTVVNYIAINSSKIASLKANATLADAALVFPSGSAKWAVWYTQGTRAIPTKTTQSISFDAITDKKAGDKFTLNAKSSVNLAIQYTIASGDASLSGNQVTAGTTAGKVKVSAFQLGNTQYAAASAEQSFCIIPVTPIISASSNVLTVSGGTTYQFYYNNQAVDNPTTSSQVKVADSGNWSVKAVTSDGCYSAMSNIVTVKVPVLGVNPSADVIMSAYPNPSSDEIRIELSAGTTLKQAKLSGGIGNEMITTKDNVLNISNLASGVYFLTVETNKGTVIKKIVKE